MGKKISWITGYVLIAVEGGQAERFLNLCVAKGIVVEKIKFQGENRFQAVFSAKDFSAIGPARRKTKVHIHILEKHGLPFFFLRWKKRKAFFLGIFLCIGIIWLLSGRIWNIHIEGNIKNSTPEILKFLEEEGIIHGMAKSNVDCSKIASLVREHYTEATWVSAKLEGSRLSITIQEGILQQETEDGLEPCNIEADVEGKIVKMVTRSGIPQVKVGDYCKKGDLLVLGRLDYLNDSQEIYKYGYVHADADVYVQHEISYYDEFPLLYEAKIREGEEKKSGYLKLGEWYFEWGSVEGKNWDSFTQEYPLRITENFFLPVSFGKKISWKYQTLEKEYSIQEAKTIAAENFYDYEKNLIKKGVQISSNNVKITVGHNSCTSSGTLQVIEKTGENVPVEVIPQPTQTEEKLGQ